MFPGRRAAPPRLLLCGFISLTAVSKADTYAVAAHKRRRPLALPRVARYTQLNKYVIPDLIRDLVTDL